MRAVRLAVAALALLFIGMTSSASASPNAATQSVAVASFAFTPVSLTINIGDSVKWTNSDPATHTVTSDTGAFNSTLQPSSGTFTFQFASAGTFAYHCAVHPSMTGSIIVRSAATAPPTPPPTVPPTAPPTAAPTARPTVAPTPQPTVAPTPEPTLAPTPTIAATPTQTAAPATTAPVAVASPSTAPTSGATRVTAVPAEDGPPLPLIVGGAAAIVIGLGALAWVLLRR